MFKKAEFTRYVQELVKEWNESDRPITIEFSTSGAFMAEKIRIFSENTPDNAIWYVHFCQTCAEYNASKQFHCELVKV